MKAPAPISVLMLEEAVVVAEDRAGADVGARADDAVADVGKMIGLGALAQRRILDLDEVADVDAGAEIGTRPQTCERPDPRALAGCAHARSGSWP